MTFGSLFAGIGGMDLGLERAGMECKWQVEIDPFCQKVLAKHWPNIKRYGDITTIRGSDLESVDLLAGGFPCQDLSVAGKRAGIDGARSGLWAHFARLIGEIRPRYVLIENVSGLLANEPMRRVLGDLSSLGFDAEWRTIRACELGAPHARARVFIIAHPYKVRCGSWGDHLPIRTGHNHWQATQGKRKWNDMERWIRQDFHSCYGSATTSELQRVDKWFPERLHRCAAVGNAVVPQVAEWIGRQILNASHLSSLSCEPTRPGNPA